MKRRISNIGETRQRKKATTKSKKYGPFPIESSYGLTSSFGTDIKKEIPSTIFIRVKARISPLKKQTNTKRIFTTKDAEMLKTEISEILTTTVVNNPHFENRFLTNVEMSSKNLSEGKRTFLRYDIFLRPIRPDSLAMMETTVKCLGQSVERRISTLLGKHGFYFNR